MNEADLVAIETAASAAAVMHPLGRAYLRDVLTLSAEIRRLLALVPPQPIPPVAPVPAPEMPPPTPPGTLPGVATI